MAKDAEVNAADDRRKADEITERNLADQMVYSTEKMLKEHRSKVSDEDAKAVEDGARGNQEGGAIGQSGRDPGLEGQANPGQSQTRRSDVQAGWSARRPAMARRALPKAPARARRSRRTTWSTPNS